jgi:hypothetical protein
MNNKWQSIYSCPPKGSDYSIVEVFSPKHGERRCPLSVFNSGGFGETDITHWRNKSEFMEATGPKEKQE